MCFSLRIIFNLNMLKETGCDYTVAGFLAVWAAAQCQTMRWERDPASSVLYNVVQSSFVTDTWALRTRASVAVGSARWRSSALSLNTRRIAVIVAYWHWERLVGGRCWWWWWGSGTIKAGCFLASSPWRRPSHLAVILNLCLSTHVGNWLLLGTGTHLIP